MKLSTVTVICLALVLCACSNKDNAMPVEAEWKAVGAKLNFSCVHEADHLPTLDSQADTLFKYALFLEKAPGPKDYAAAARYYRIAAAHGHYKANHNLQLLVSTGIAESPDAPKETIDLVELLITAGIPGGYYDMGHFLELGYGVKQDQKKALVYFRKAADLGSPEAQAYIGRLLEPEERAPEIARQMRQCAMDQGNHDATNELGIDFATDQRYTEAVRAFQRGVMAGDTMSASFLEEGFKGPPTTDQLNYLALPNDPERSKRYHEIWKFLTDRAGLNPKMPDLDQIVPLPPAELPSWDGTFQWQKEQEAAKPPQKPDEKLVERLAREKNLDPATGLPLVPAKSKRAERIPLGTTIRTGDVCPQNGIWTARQWSDFGREATRKFRKGETMPQLALNNPRFISVLDALLGMRVHRTNADWSLKAYTDEA